MQATSVMHKERNELEEFHEAAITQESSKLTKNYCFFRFADGFDLRVFLCSVFTSRQKGSTSAREISNKRSHA